jgi:hypothetical protein
MMDLRSLQRDKVFVEKADGSRTGPHKATVSQNTAVISDDQLDVTDGEKLIRPLPNGNEEVYLILNSEFSPGLASIPAHFNLTLRKTTAIQPSPPKQTTVNIHNTSGIQVGDHNVLNIQNALNELVQRIDSSTAPPEQKAEAKGKLTALLQHPLVSAALGGIVSGVAS